MQARQPLSPAHRHRGLLGDGGGGKRYVNLYSEPWRVTNFSGRMGNCEKWARISHQDWGQNDLKCGFGGMVYAGNWSYFRTL